MKKLENFIVREIGGSYVMMPFGETTLKFNGLINANESAAFIWEHIEEVENVEEMANLLCQEFDVTPEKALEDCKVLLAQMKQAGWIE